MSSPLPRSALGGLRRALRLVLGSRVLDPPGTAGPLRRPGREPKCPDAAPPGRPARTSGSPAYPGDHVGPVHVEYAPVDDSAADPGEVVWSWVPYEEDHRRGKDRPVLVVGREGPWLLALPLTSKDHDRDAVQEAAAGRHWVDIGAGAWDPAGRPSEARVDRVVRIDPRAVRRTGARLDRPRFDAVAAELARRT